MRAGMQTAPQSIPSAKIDESLAISEYLDLLKRLRDHEGPLHESPLLGILSPQEWRKLHLAHTAHHLGFLEPAPAAN